MGPNNQASVSRLNKLKAKTSHLRPCSKEQNQVQGKIRKAEAAEKQCQKNKERINNDTKLRKKLTRRCDFRTFMCSRCDKGNKKTHHATCVNNPWKKKKHKPPMKCLISLLCTEWEDGINIFYSLDKKCKNNLIQLWLLKWGDLHVPTDLPDSDVHHNAVAADPPTCPLNQNQNKKLNPRKELEAKLESCMCKTMGASVLKKAALITMSSQIIKQKEELLNIMVLLLIIALTRHIQIQFPGAGQFPSGVASYEALLIGWMKNKILPNATYESMQGTNLHLTK